MLPSTAQAPWFQDQSTGEYYYWSPNEAAYVFQSGRRVYMPPDIAGGTRPQHAQATPRTPLVSAAGQLAPPQPSLTGYPSLSPGQYRYQEHRQSSSTGSVSTVSGSSPPSQQLPSPWHQRAAGNDSADHGAYLNAHVASMSLNQAANSSSGYSYHPPSASNTGNAPRSRGWSDSYAGPPDKQVEARPAPTRSAHKNIVGTPGEYETLDERYRRKNRDFCKLGRVFKMHWSEPAAEDDNATVVTERTEILPTEFSRDKRFGQRIHSKIRWFIVVRPGTGRSACVPIVTYRGRGCTKTGITKNEHAMAYASRQAPDPHPQERPTRHEKPLRTPIRIQPDETGDILQNMSRIDYGRVYTVEHNVKAMPFGWVHDKSQKDFTYAFEAVFFNKGSEEEQSSDSGSAEHDSESA